MKYTIEIGLRDCQYPQRYDGETDAEYEGHVKWWEIEGQYSAYWRLNMIDGDGITAHHFAMKSGIFRKTENGSKELSEMVSGAALALSHRQASKKNELLMLRS